MSQPVCAVVGVGPGNGASFVRRFASEGYAVAALARNAEYLAELEGSVGGCTGIVCDVTDPSSIEAAFARIEASVGAVDVLVYNAGSGIFGNIENVSAEELEQAWRVNTLGLYHSGHRVIPGMIERGAGAISVVGATASLRGGANFAAFASAKAAQRSLAQSMARHLAPKGIHVSLVIVDGVIDMPRTRALFAGKPDDFFLQSDDIAATLYHVTRQPRSAWTFEYDVRPNSEAW